MTLYSLWPLLDHAYSWQKKIQKKTPTSTDATVIKISPLSSGFDMKLLCWNAWF